MKKIVLPPTEGGYYMFGELPKLIAEALHPDEMYPDDVYLSAIVWRDDGTQHGQYFRCTPPTGLIADGMTCLDGWSVTSVTKEEEAEDPDAGEWHRLRKEAENSDRLSDGSLLILAEKTQRGVMRVLNIGLERDWYKKRMTTDARRDEDDNRRLCVVDSNLNSLTYTNGSALDRGWVHIDKLNQWGATLDTVNVFSVAEVVHRGASQQEAHKAPTVSEAISGYVEKVMSANPRFTADELHRHMKRHAGDDDSPFSRVKPGEELYCVDANASCGLASVRAALTRYRKNKAKTQPSTVEAPWKR